MADQTATIPRGWKITILGNQIKVGRGSSPRPIQDFISKKGISWVKIADASASETRFIKKTKECIKEEGRSTSVKVGDLIVSNSATPGIPKFMGIDACVHDGWLVFDDYKDLDKLYLYYFFLDYRRTLEYSASGTVFVNLQTEIVRNIEMNLPPFAEQRAIAAVLSSLDDKIELLREQNKTLEATAQAIFKEWFVNFNLPAKVLTKAGFPNGKIRFIDSELGKIPEGWRIVKLGELVRHVKKSISPSQNPSVIFNHYSIPSFDQGRIPERSLGEKILSNKYLIENDCFLVSKLNPKTPRVWTIISALENSICSTEFQIVEPRHKGHFSFVHSILNSDDFTKEFASKVKGTSSSHQRANPEDILEHALTIPGDNLMLQFENTIQPLILKVENNGPQIQTLSAFRDALLPKLMKGQIRVRGFNN